MLLAFDTSTEYTSVAVYGEQGLLAERTWRSGRRHAEQVLESTDSLLRDVGVGPAQLQVVAVAIGPGSWSGVRVGISQAKGLAVARNLPIIGVSSLEVLAYPHQRAGRPVIPLIALGRDRYAVAEYRLRRRWGPVSAPSNLSQDELVAAVPELALVCGDIDQRLADALRQARGQALVVASPALGLRRAGYLAEIAWSRHLAADYDDLVALEPLYLGSPIKE